MFFSQSPFAQSVIPVQQHQIVWCRKQSRSACSQVRRLLFLSQETAGTSSKTCSPGAYEGGEQRNFLACVASSLQHHFLSPPLEWIPLMYVAHWLLEVQM